MFTYFARRIAGFKRRMHLERRDRAAYHRVRDRQMRAASSILILSALSLVCAPEPRAQTPANQSLSAPTAPNFANPAPAAPSSASRPPADSDATLEVAPKIAPPGPPAEQQPPEATDGNNSPSSASLVLSPAAHGRPYLGISVQSALVRFHKEEIHGLEIIGVDKGSPAERAGLTVPSGMTTVGATGETAGFFLGPVGELMKPLLARSGQLGSAGDMIVAVDDQRVTDADSMNRVLANVAPGETVWFTLMRITRDGKVKNEKIPIVMGSAGDSTSSSFVRHH
jgi:hypothetical protein